MSQYNIVILNADGKTEANYVFGSDNMSSSIYIDDTIRTIKKKILMNCVEANDKCYEEIYLFSDVPIGIKLPKNVPTNPFNFSEYEGDNISMKDDGALLMNYASAGNDTFYVCFVEEFKLKPNIDEMLPLYFPGITSIENLDTLRSKNAEVRLTDSFVAETEYVSHFKELGKRLDPRFKETSEGIQHLDIVYTPDTQLNIQLVDVFNLVHATELLPLSQLNAMDRDKQYRLWAPNTATNGERIPYVNKARINEFVKKFTDPNRVSFYMFEKKGTNKATCEFVNHRGRISFRFFVEKFTKEKSMSETNAFIQKHMNLIIQQINDHIELSGRSIEPFQSLEERNVKINDIGYALKFSYQKQIKFDKPTRDCIAGIFDVYDDALLSFKRISNYNIQDSIYFLLRQMRDESDDAKATLLKEVFNLSSQDLQKYLLDAAPDKRNIKRPGFILYLNTDVSLVGKKRSYAILMRGINSIGHLNTIPNHIYALMNIVTSLSTNKAKQKLCKIKKRFREVNVLPADDVESDTDDDAESDTDDDAESDTDDDAISEPEEDAISEPEEDAISEPDEDAKSEPEEDAESEPEEDAKSDSEEDAKSDSEEDAKSDSDDDSVDDAGKQYVLGLLDSDSDSDSDSETDANNDMSGGAKEKNEEAPASKEIVDRYKENEKFFKLWPHPMLKKMQEADPILFPQSKVGKFNPYSRSCAKPLVTKSDPVPETRMPVLLTNEEYDNISTNHRDTYTEAISYRSGENNKFWYICPRYFALKENRSLSQTEVDSGKYGKVIPGVPRKDFPKGNGYNILQFNKEHVYPGFLKPEKHSTGKCMPCCFKSWDKEANVKLRKSCTGEEENAEPEKKKTTNYIEKGHPLKEGAQGYLDPRLLHLLGVDNKTCDDKQSKTCFLRRGVESHKSQTFIASIAKLKAETREFSIQQMKDYMMEHMTIDHFVTMQNGNLVDIFYDAEIEMEPDLEKDTKHTKNTKKNALSQMVQKWSDPEGDAYYERVIRAFQNFKAFLSDNAVLIDHTYLWDYICMPGVVERKGINLVILEIDKDTAMTNSVNILCPTNHYVSSVFEDTRKTAILFKSGNTFEPIFQKKNEDRYLFSFTKSILRDKLTKIKQVMSEGCSASKGIETYEFEQNIPYNLLMDALQELTNGEGLPKYVKTQNVLNYNGKIVGVMVKNNEKLGTEEQKGDLQEAVIEEFMVPCRPSPLMYYDDDLELQTSDSIWLHNVPSVSYQATREFLDKLASESNGIIKSKPLIKISEDGIINGILTETEQYVPVRPTDIKEVNDDLRTNEQTDYIRVESISTANQANAVEELDQVYLGVIREHQIYNVFRTTLRVLLNYETNKPIKIDIQGIIDSDDEYIDKLNAIISLLRSVMKAHVSFVDDYDIDSVIAQTPCKINTEPSECMITIPKQNLFNGLENEEVYFGRIADELIRYHVLKTFIMSTDNEKPVTLLPIIQADLNKDEIIVGRNQIDQNYFKTLKNVDANEYQNFNSHDTQTHNANEQETPETIENLSNLSKVVTW